ncbi:hypothetical protein TNCV_958581 [Trichonephila clavipes]|nr:hypothetical protein TNCV_958581 [Trichonephila clavipes]
MERSYLFFFSGSLVARTYDVSNEENFDSTDFTFAGSTISLKQLSVFVKAKVGTTKAVTGSAYLDALQLWLFPQSFSRSDVM